MLDSIYVETIEHQAVIVPPSPRHVLHIFYSFCTQNKVDI